MPASPIPGFIKKKVAAKKFNRSMRQLTRDITVAMELKDEKILQHLKLRTADGETFDGGVVTTELVNKLHKIEGRNPMWYLRRSWLEETFGRRDEQSVPSEKVTSDEPPDVPPSPSTTVANDEVRQLLREAVTELKGEKEFLKSQLEAKDKQLSEALERDRESNVLLRNLQELMGNLQEGLLALPKPSTESSKPRPPTVEPAVASGAESLTPEPLPTEGVEVVTTTTKPKRTTGTSPKRKSVKKSPARRAKKSSTSKKRTATEKKTKPPSFSEKHLPTLSRFFSRSK